MPVIICEYISVVPVLVTESGFNSVFFLHWSEICLQTGANLLVG
ncbi:hypothetical protein [Marinilabilia salmonicolor]|nr:hypothetical protein [Marinilabilia salmonicolor]